MSPKVYVPLVLTVLAGIVLRIITGDNTALIVSLTGIAGGGAGALAPPTRSGGKDFTQADAERQGKHFGRRR